MEICWIDARKSGKHPETLRMAAFFWFKFMEQQKNTQKAVINAYTAFSSRFWPDFFPALRDFLVLLLCLILLIVQSTLTAIWKFIEKKRMRQNGRKDVFCFHTDIFVLFHLACNLPLHEQYCFVLLCPYRLECVGMFRSNRANFRYWICLYYHWR